MVDVAPLLRCGWDSDGSGLAVLLHQELASVVDEGIEREAELLGDRARRLNEREAALDDRERNL